MMSRKRIVPIGMFFACFFAASAWDVLHKSVWVTPRDIRPDFDDLARAGGVEAFAYLFESRTVLGRSAQDVVGKAWDMDRLREQQRWYLDVYTENLQKAESGSVGSKDLIALAREELTAYVTVMETDPFLPRPLWPASYAGEAAWTFHQNSSRRLGSRL